MLPVEGWFFLTGLSNLKESHLVQTAEFVTAQGIDHEPAFNWWVKHVLKKRGRIVVKVRKWQARYLRRSYKFVIELPKSEEQTLASNRIAQCQSSI